MRLISEEQLQNVIGYIGETTSALPLKHGIAVLQILHGLPPLDPEKSTDPPISDQTE